MNYNKTFKEPLIKLFEETNAHYELLNVIEVDFQHEGSSVNGKLHFSYKNKYNEKTGVGSVTVREYASPKELYETFKQFVKTSNLTLKKLKEKKAQETKDDYTYTNVKRNKLIRKFLKSNFPECKFSVRKSNNTIYVMLKGSPENPFKESKFIENIKGYNTYNVRHFGNECYDELKVEFLEMFFKIYRFIELFRYDNSEPMIDYFDTNFYYQIGIQDIKVG